jgi:hypothetical protein
MALRSGAETEPLAGLLNSHFTVQWGCVSQDDIMITYQKLKRIKCRRSTSFRTGLPRIQVVLKHISDLVRKDALDMAGLRSKLYSRRQPRTWSNYT